MCFFFFSSRRRHTRYWRDWSSDVCSSDLELNVTLPLMARNVLESIRLLANVSRLLADRCADGITANVERCRELAESSPSLVMPLNKNNGSEVAATVAKQPLVARKPIPPAAI